MGFFLVNQQLQFLVSEILYAGLTSFLKEGGLNGLGQSKIHKNETSSHKIVADVQRVDDISPGGGI